MKSILCFSFLILALSTLPLVSGANETQANVTASNSTEFRPADCPGCPPLELLTYPPVATPTPQPTPRSTYPPRPGDNADSWDSTTSVDVLVAALFLIAAGWLVLAIIYSVLILIMVRMRARGELDIYDENFGRLFLCGRRCFIPLGCILRRHVIAMHSRSQRQTIRVMTREERRSAMEELLIEGGRNEEGKSGEMGIQREQATSGTDVLSENVETTLDHNPDDHDSLNGPMCSICLMEYEDVDAVFTAANCVHRFHRECLMDWLERRNNTECPCCREPMVDDDDVWELVQRSRREQRKQRRQENRRNSFFARLVRNTLGQTTLQEQSIEGNDAAEVEEGRSGREDSTEVILVSIQANEPSAQASEGNNEETRNMPTV